MTHNLGRLVPYGLLVRDTRPLDLIPSQGPLGGPRFIILHFDSVSLSPGAHLEVPLGYDNDVFTENSGTSFWSKPIDVKPNSPPIQIRITGGTGTARLKEYAVGEPTITPNQIPGTPFGSKSNPDPFLHTDPYEEPIYETRVMCHTPPHGGHLEWVNDGCTLNPMSIVVKERISNAVGFIVLVHEGHLSSCSGTLIAPDLFLTARHCLTDPNGGDVQSASVTFEYETSCDGRRRSFHKGRFFKVIGEVKAGAPPSGFEPLAEYDWVILRLDSTSGVLPAPLVIRPTEIMYGEYIFTTHHPNGAVKKFQSWIHDGGDISGFSFAGGSSGSALFDIYGQLVRGPLSKGMGCNVTYAPLTPIRAWLADPTPTLPPVVIDVVIEVDRSVSMAKLASLMGRTKLEEIKDALSLFVHLIREGYGHRIGLVTFDTSATTDMFLDSIDKVKSKLTGPAPFTTGQIGSIIAEGGTSINDGLMTAISGIESNSANDRVIILLTDGLQNTQSLIRNLDGLSGSSKLYVIGFGSDSELNGSLLSTLARQRGGKFIRASDGLALRKFLGLYFGIIFETGLLNAQDCVLRADQRVSNPHQISVCDEEQITLIVGWDNSSTPLQAHIKNNKDKPLNEKEIEPVRGRTWVFSRIPLQQDGSHGSWQFTVDRLQANNERLTDVRYFFLVVSSGGPKLMYLGGPQHVYTGDYIDALVGIHYRNSTTPRADVELTVDVPTISIGKFVNDFGLQHPFPTDDPVDAFYHTLQTIAHKFDGTLPIPTLTLNFPLFDDGIHDDGAMEPDGVYNNRLGDISRTEGIYHFRAFANYGKEGFKGTRETSWSIYVQLGIDPECTIVTLDRVEGPTNDRHGTLTMTPLDKYCNPLGPGRANLFTISAIPGVNVIGAIRDLGDGRYDMNISWDESVTQVPGVLLQQPDRKPVIIMPPKKDSEKVVRIDSRKAANDLLNSFGLNDPKVRNVQIKNINLEIELNDQKDL